jgi:regulator of protease activity HflC (stomatin/prohibitin superfamily)
MSDDIDTVAVARTVKKVGKWAGLGLFVLVTSTSSIYTVDQGERVVVTRFGEVQGVSEPGLHLKIPFVDDTTDFDVRTNTKVYDNVVSYSKDQQPATLRISVTWKANESAVEDIYQDYGTVGKMTTRILDTRVADATKRVFGGYTAVSAIQDRSTLVADVNAAITESVTGPIEIVSVQIEDIQFSAAYEQSVEDRMLAQVEVERLRQNAQREMVQAEIRVTQANAERDANIAKAEGEAERIRLESTAQAEAVRVQGEAEAEVIKQKGEALRDNPNLVELTKAEKWNGELPTTMVPGTATPFVNVK